MDSGQYGQRIRGRANAPLRPSGPHWLEYRRRLFAKWAMKTGAVECFYCSEPIGRTPDGKWLGEIEHRINIERAPELAWREYHDDGQPQLVPVHGGGTKRSPIGDLACNSIAASNSAVRDELGRPLPFSAEYKARKVAERKAWLARGGGRAGRPGLAKNPGTSPRPVKSPAATAVSKFTDCGRDW